MGRVLYHDGLQATGPHRACYLRPGLAKIWIRILGAQERVGRRGGIMCFLCRGSPAFPKPKWNFRKWRTGSLFFHHILSLTAQRQHSRLLSTISRNPSYAKHSSNPPGKLPPPISVSLRRRVSASGVTPFLNTMRVHLQAKSVPPRGSQLDRIRLVLGRWLPSGLVVDSLSQRFSCAGNLWLVLCYFVRWRSHQF